MEITPPRETLISERLQEARGRDALDILFPKPQTMRERIGPVSFFNDENEAKDHVVSRLWLELGRTILKGEEMDWEKWDPITMIMEYRISVKGLGRADATGIGRPASLGMGEPPKKGGLLSRIKHAFRGD